MGRAWLECMKTVKKSAKSTIFFDINTPNQYYCAPMFDKPFDEPLPRQADLRKLAKREAHFNVHLNAANLPRFAGAIYEGKGFVEAELHFGVNEEYLRYIQGKVYSEVEMVCQRCMEPVAVAISSDINLGIVSDEDKGRQLPKSMDPLIVAEDELMDLNEIVEDELLLSMPFVSYHEPDECSGKQNYEFSAGETKASAEGKENPFKVLEQLKSGKE